MRLIKVLCYFFLAIYSFQLQAQYVIYRKNTIYVDGKAYAYLYKRGSAWATEYSFQTLNNKELITITPVTKKLGEGYDYVYYEVNFIGLNLKTQMQDDNDLARRLAYELGAFHVLVNDSLDPDAVHKFLEKYPADRFSKSSFLAY